MIYYIMLSNNTANSIREHFFSSGKPIPSKRYDEYPTNESIEIKTDNSSELDTPIYMDTSLTSVTSVSGKVLSKVVTYDGLQELNKDIIDDKLLNNEIDICIYKINNHNINPYILFGLFKDDNDVLIWPTYNMKKRNIKQLVKFIKDMFNPDEPVITYEGNYEYKGKKQLWFQYSKKNDEIQRGKYSNKIWWTLPYEIINKKKNLTFSIDESVINFFLMNSSFIYLKNKEGDIYEMPIVAYYGNYYKRTAFAATIGHTTEGPYAQHGPYYHFNSYKRAMRYACWAVSYKPIEIDGEFITNNDDGKYIKGGLVKYAIFLHNYCTMITLVEKSKDKKSIIITKNIDQLTGDIDDTNFKYNWVSEYNSLVSCRYLKDEKDDSTIKEYQDPTYILKDYIQQFPLEYYYVNTDKITSTNIDTDKLVIE